MEFYYNTKRGELSHEGVKGKSGRYPWGSGDRPYQRLEKPKRRGFFFRRKDKDIKKDNNNKALKIESLSDKISEIKKKNLEKRVEKLNKSKEKRELKETKQLINTAEVRERGEKITVTEDKMKYMYNNRKHYSTNELRDIVNRYSAEVALKKEVDAAFPVRETGTIKKFFRKIDDLSKSAEKTTQTINRGIRSYNACANLANNLMPVFIDGKTAKKYKMPIITGYSQQPSTKK